MSGAEFDTLIGASEVIAWNVRVLMPGGDPIDTLGRVRVWPGAGRAVYIEISEDVYGSRMVAELDRGRPAGARSELDVVALRAMLQAATRADGISDPITAADQTYPGAKDSSDG